MKLLLDMNLSPRWVAYLAGTGIESVHWSSVGPHSASDAEIMAYALKHDCVVLTQDLDFSSILAATRGTKPSVVQIRVGKRCSGQHRTSPRSSTLAACSAVASQPSEHWSDRLSPSGAFARSESRVLRARRPSG